jgi:hypothetical protein
MDKEEMKCFVLGSVISADNDEFTEEEKQGVIARMKDFGLDQDWVYVLQPIKDEEKREKLIRFFGGKN